jgi:hypothetical protein
VNSGTSFPQIDARNLQSLDVRLPDAFAGERNVVMIAFQRQHQSLVDSWVPWLEKESVSDPGLRFYEIPTIGRMWAPVRRFIDGGMASAIRVPEVLQRTLTVYGDVNRLTSPLGISDRSTITVVLVDRGGQVHWQGSGAFAPSAAEELKTALEALRQAR